MSIALLTCLAISPTQRVRPVLSRFFRAMAVTKFICQDIRECGHSLTTAWKFCRRIRAVERIRFANGLGSTSKKHSILVVVNSRPRCLATRYDGMDILTTRSVVVRVAGVESGRG